MEFFWGVVRVGELRPQAYLWYALLTKNAITIQKLTFRPKYPIFLVKKHIFAPSGHLEPHHSMFSTRKRCLIGFLIWGYQKFYALSPYSWIFGLKTAKFSLKLTFLPKYWHFWPIWSNAWPKNNADKLSRWFSVMLVPKLLLTPIKIRIFGPKMAKFGPKFAFLVIFWPGLAGSFGALLVGWLVVVARAVSRKTPIYFMSEVCH